MKSQLVKSLLLIYLFFAASNSLLGADEAEKNDSADNATMQVLAEQLVDQLQEWIVADLPFLVAERQLRIERLRNALTSPKLDIAEKIRRIFEAYRIEAEYGFAFESYRAGFNENDAVVVDFLHIGRNILIYRTMDGRRIGVWDRYTASWQPLGLKYRYSIKQAFNVADNITPPKILRLPVQLTRHADKERVAEIKVNTGNIANKELVAVIRNTARELQTMITDSFISWLLPHYQTTLKPLLQSSRTLEINDIKILQRLFIELYEMQVQTGFFNGKLILEDGTITERNIIHIGPFTLLHDGKFLNYEASLGFPVVIAKSPDLLLARAAANITEGLGSDFVKMPVDITRGAALTALASSFTMIDRIIQGGIIAYIILILGVYALGLVLYKIYTLYKSLGLVRIQKYNSSAELNNPLGRILVIADYATASIEELEWKIEQAVLSETQRLGWGFSTIKVLIVAAPLLGLLGTVLGMIETFQAITLFGTNDPKIVSQGIGQALVTTLLGLCVAVPLLLLYNWATTYSKEIREILEQQSAGLIVERLNRTAR